MSEVRRNLVPQTPDVLTCLRRVDPAAEMATMHGHAALPVAWHVLAMEGVLSLAHARLDAHRFVSADGIDVARLQAFRDVAVESLQDWIWIMSESLAQSPWPGQQAQRARAHEAYCRAVSGLIEQLDAAIADRTLPVARPMRESVPAAVGERLALLKDVEDAVLAHFAAAPGVSGLVGDLDTIGLA